MNLREEKLIWERKIRFLERKILILGKENLILKGNPILGKENIDFVGGKPDFRRGKY